ncbi:MAG: response regulator [Anaerolineae bacterium]|nr:response regulator [Anaerolineae bacterium]
MIWLIAEDEADILNLLTMVITVWGYTPLAFESGQKAWDWLDTVESGAYTGPLPDFALMDIRMPGKKGNEVSRRIRSVNSLKHIPVALMTAFSLDEADRLEMQTADGVDAIISKPLPGFDDLHIILKNVIQEKQSAKSE